MKLIPKNLTFKNLVILNSEGGPISNINITSTPKLNETYQYDFTDSLIEDFNNRISELKNFYKKSKDIDAAVMSGLYSSNYPLDKETTLYYMQTYPEAYNRFMKSTPRKYADAVKEINWRNDNPYKITTIGTEMIEKPYLSGTGAVFYNPDDDSKDSLNLFKEAIQERINLINEKRKTLLIKNPNL